MDDVAEGASVSHGLAYRYFAGKDELVTATVERAIQEGRAGLDAMLRETGAPEVRLAALLTALIENRLERPELYRLLEHVHDSGSVPEALRALIGAQGEEVFARMREWIVEGQSAGTVHPGDPDELLTAVAASLQGLSRLAMRGGVPFDRRPPDPSIFLRMVFPTGADRR
jgi:AcrR family transcriptional regulator